MAKQNGKDDSADKAPKPNPALASTLTQPEAIKKLQESLRKMQVQPRSTPVHNAAEAAAHEYKFWKTQPVVQLEEKEKKKDYVGPLEPAKEDVRQEPYGLPEGFVWETIDVNDDKHMDDLYQLLNENYVEDDDNMFRFDYSRQFLKWALMPPGWKREWHTAVRAKKSGVLLAFISAIPANMRIDDREQTFVEINFLCVHKKLRTKRLAPVLIMEITRRVHVEGIFQAAFTAGVFLPTPVACCRYWHRSLNPKKLIDVRFSQLAPNMTMQRTIKMYKVADAPVTPGLRRMEAKDVGAVARLHREYQKQFKMTPVFSEDEVAHWLLPRDNVVMTYVVEDPETHELTDFTSFYTLNSTVIGHPRHNTLNAAYAFYTVNTKAPLKQLVNDALIMAKQLDFDVFNALDLMHNSDFLKDLKFGIGDGQLRYYLYNYAHPEIAPSDVGLVLL